MNPIEAIDERTAKTEIAITIPLSFFIGQRKKMPYLIITTCNNLKKC
jgi:hypothetical protein